MTLDMFGFVPNAQRTSGGPDHARAYGRFIDSGIDAALIKTGREDSEQLTDRAESAHQAIPEMTIHPIGQTRAHPAERDDRASIKFVDPHFIFEESKQLGLRKFERIDVGGTLSILHASFAIHPAAQSEAHAHENQRKKKRRLNQAHKLNACSATC
jgi:hypothetical protein